MADNVTMTEINEFIKMNFVSPSDTIKNSLRNQLNILLSDITESQRNLFDKIYPLGVNNLDQEQLCSAINICHRTIAKNTIKRNRDEKISGN